jgi:pantetheine-phosphate adenylyltransferase
MTVAVYPGSFDPFTNGHKDIAARALKIFDRLIIAIAVNRAKAPLFTLEERQEMIRELYKDEPRVEVDSFSGLLVDYLKERQAGAVIRGLRAVSDFEYEFQLANMNRKLYPKAETLFLMTGHDYFYLSSMVVKEVASLGGCLAGLVPDLVLARLKEKFGGMK